MDFRLSEIAIFARGQTAMPRAKKQRGRKAAAAPPGPRGAALNTSGNRLSRNIPKKAAKKVPASVGGSDKSKRRKVTVQLSPGSSKHCAVRLAIMQHSPSDHGTVQELADEFNISKRSVYQQLAGCQQWSRGQGWEEECLDGSANKEVQGHIDRTRLRHDLARD